jgi:hypothetical protein
MKSLSINEFESEVIPSSELVRMMSRLNNKGVEITVGKVPPTESKVLRTIGAGIIWIGAIYFGIHILIWFVK